MDTTTTMAREKARSVSPHPTPLPAGKSEQSGVPDASALYRLMAWLSPAYPIGAFSYSSGIEWAVEAGDITFTTPRTRRRSSAGSR